MMMAREKRKYKDELVQEIGRVQDCGMKQSGISVVVSVVRSGDSKELEIAVARTYQTKSGEERMKRLGRIKYYEAVPLCEHLKNAQMLIEHMYEEERKHG